MCTLFVKFNTLVRRLMSFLSFLQCRTWRFWLATLAVLGGCLYVCLALSPSSYAMAFEWLGLEKQGLLLGTPRGIRSDEWFVLTPYFQIAVANGLKGVNMMSPYQEVLRSFQPLPILDWSLLFKPQLWGFWALPPAHAYSLYFLVLAAAFMLGWAWLLQQLRLSPAAAWVVSALLFFSPIVQVWWTTTGGAFALAPWPVLTWLLIERRVLRILACTYALLAWVLACAYPPFLYACGFALALMVLVVRRPVFTPVRLIDAVLASVLAGGLFVLYFQDLIAVMRATVYPGQRVSAPGDVELGKLLAHVFPGITTYEFEPLAPWAYLNACEIAVLSSFLPLYTLVLLDGRRLGPWLARNRSSVLLMAVGLAFLCSWLFFTMPDVVARLTGLTMVPPSRAVLGFGLIVNIGCAIALCCCGIRLNPVRLGVLAGITVVGLLLKQAFGGEGARDLYGWMDVVPFFCLGLVVLVARWVANGRAQVVAILAIAALGNSLSYGFFNPVQSTKPIFAMDTAAVNDILVARGARILDDGTMVVPGHYGALLAGMGFRTVNHTLYYPQQHFFRNYFPDLPAISFNELFNRYAHISVGEGKTPRLVAGDHVEVPASAFVDKARQEQ